MQTGESILDLLREQGEQALKRSRRAVIIQPGAIGDCILTLPLARFMKKSLQLGAMDMIGRSDYISYFPTRTCIDKIRTLDSLQMHRLFCDPLDFQPTRRDSLIEAFAGYSWIVSFLGEPQSPFEQNLIFAANCSQSTEVILLPDGRQADRHDHVSARHIRQLCANCGLKIKSPSDLFQSGVLIQPTQSDRRIGAQIIQQAGLNTDASVVVLCPGSGGRAKCWHFSNFLAVAEMLESAGAQPLFLLGPAELERLSPDRIIDIDRTGPFLTDLSLEEVLQVLSSAHAFVGNDSGITHLAAAIGLDTIALFGPTDPATYRPLGPGVCVIEDKNPQFALGPSEELQRRVLLQLEEFCA